MDKLTNQETDLNNAQEETECNQELLEALAETDEMINNPEKYPRYNNREELKKALLSDD